MRHSCFPRTRSIRLITTRHARSFSRQVGNKVASADIPESDYANWKPPRFLSLPDLPPLPPAREWKAAFPSVKAAHARAYVSDFDTALAIADAFVPEGSLNKTIVEAYPGVGMLTRALLSLPKERIAKVIVLEDASTSFLPAIEPLVHADPRLVLVTESPPWSWEVYNLLERRQLLPKPLDWNAGVHPELHFICHLPGNTLGEQLLAQWHRCIPEKTWLFGWGRVPMSMVMNRYTWNRHAQPVGHQHRGKMSVITDATTLATIPIPPTFFLPGQDKFYPPNLVDPALGPPRMTGYGLRNPTITTYIPLENQVIAQGDMEIWDFLTRQLYVNKKTPLKKVIPQLAAGAQSLLKMISGPDVPEERRVDISKTPRDLSLQDIAHIVQAFKDWPFAPTDLSVGEPQDRDQRGRK